MCLSVCRHRGIFPKKAKPESRGTVFTFSWGICCRKEPVWRVFRQRGPWARHERSRAGLSKISFLCRLPELPNVGRPQLPLPTTKRRCPDGYRLLVVGRVHIAETPEGSPRQSGAAREEQGRVEQNFFPVPLARTAERRQTSITSSRNTKGDAPMGIAFWWWEGYILPKPLKGPPRQSGAAREEQGRIEHLPELPNVGRPQLPLPVTQKAMPRWVSPFGGGKR